MPTQKNVVLACNPGVGGNLNDGAAVAITVAAGGDKGAYVDFVVPSGKPANVRIVLTDDNGTATLYSGTQNGSVRLRQKVEYTELAMPRFSSSVTASSFPKGTCKHGRLQGQSPEKL